MLWTRFSHDHCSHGSLERALENQLQKQSPFLFQPAEENQAGGMLMYEDGVLYWLPDQFMDFDVRPDLKVGQIATNTHTLCRNLRSQDSALPVKVVTLLFHMKQRRSGCELFCNSSPISRQP